MAFLQKLLIKGIVGNVLSKDDRDMKRKRINQLRPSIRGEDQVMQCDLKDAYEVV